MSRADHSISLRDTQLAALDTAQVVSDIDYRMDERRVLTTDEVACQSETDMLESGGWHSERVR